MQPVHPKGDQSWVFVGRTDAEAETPILWPPHVKSWLIGKDPDAGRDWVQEEKGTTEDKMAGWHHRLDGHKSEWTPGAGGQGGLKCCDLWGCKELDTTERLNWTDYLFFNLIEFVTILLLFYAFFFSWPWDMWDPSSLTRNQTCTPALEGKVLKIGLPGKSQWWWTKGWHGCCVATRMLAGSPPRAQGEL